MVEIFRCPECNKPYKTKKCYDSHYKLCVKGEIKYIYHNLTEEQQDAAWALLNMGADNRDKVIAQRLGLKVSDIRLYLQYKSKQLLEKINNR